MRAWLIDSFQGVEKLRLVEVPDPVPKAGEVVLRVKRAALNPADAYLAKGEYPAKPTLPHVLGRDGIGEVIAVGNEVKDIRVGDVKLILRGETGVTRWGTFAEKVAVAVDHLVELPAGWTVQQSAGAALVYLTAFQALTQWDDLPSNATILISGASGGVGVASMQLATAMGHRVVALSRSVDKQKRLVEIGAALALDPHANDWPAQLKSKLGGKVDLAIDNVGGDLFPKLIATLADRGRVSVIGRLAGPVPEFNTATLFSRRIRIGGVFVGAYTTQESRAAWTKIVDLLNRANARPIVDREFDFGSLPAAFEHLHRGPMGKVLLSIE